MDKIRTIIRYLIFLVFYFTSYVTIFVISNTLSLYNDYNNYLNNAPYAPQILINSGLNFVYKNYISENKIGNKLNNILYIILFEGSPYGSNATSQSLSRKYVLTKEEVEEIKKIKYVESCYIKNLSENAIFLSKIITPNRSHRVDVLTPQYLKALHPPLKKGRYFDENDPFNVILLNETLAKSEFGTDELIGKKVEVEIIEGSGNKSVEKFTVIGILSNISEFYFDSGYLPIYAVIPYREIKIDLGEYALIEGGEYEIDIIPKKGKENHVMKEIKNILKEKFDEMVFFNMSYLKNSIYFEIRRERVLLITLVGFIAVLASIFLIISFLYFDISYKKREIGIKRAMGATKKHIFYEYATYFTKTFLISFSFGLVLVYASLPIFEKYNFIGYSTFSLKPTDVIKFKVDFLSIIISLIILYGIIYFITKFTVFKNLKFTPSILIKSLQDLNYEKLYSNIAIISICIVLIITSISIISTIDKYRKEVIKVIPDNSYIMHTTVGFAEKLKYFVSYEDYKEIKELFKDEAFVALKYSPLIFESKVDSKKESIRVYGATEDLNKIYNLRILNGRFFNDNELNYCVVGYNLSTLNNLRIGDNYMGMEVIGILDKTESIIDNTFYINIKDFEKLYNPKGWSMLLVKPKNVNEKENIILKISNYLKNKYPDKEELKIRDINKYLNSVVNSRIGINITILFFSILSLFSTFIYFINSILIDGIKRSKEIGIKRAIGATQKVILIEYLYKVLKLNLISLIFSIPLGISLSYFLVKREGLKLFLHPSILIIFVFLYLLIVLVFTYIPVKIISKIEPKEALKIE